MKVDATETNEANKGKQRNALSSGERRKHRDLRDGLMRLFVETSSKKEFLDGAARLIRDWCGCDCVGIRAVDEWENIPYVSYIGFSPEFIESECWLSLKEDHCACIRIISGNPEPQDASAITEGGSFCTSDSVRFLDTLTEEEKTRYRGVCISTGYRSIAIIPIRYAEKVLGAIHLTALKENAFAPGTVEFIESIAPLVGESVYRFHVEEKLQRNYQIQSTLASLLRLSMEDVTMGEIPRRALDIIHAAPDSVLGSRACLFLTEGEQTLVLKAHDGVDKATLCKCSRLAFGECLCGLAALTQQMQFSNHFSKPDGVVCYSARPYKHYSVPIVFGGKTLGVLHVHMKEGYRRDPREEEFLYAVANTLAGIIARKRAEEELRSLSRRLVQIQEQERRSIGRELHDEIGQSMTVLMLALDSVKHAPLEKVATALAEAQEVADEVMQQVRNMSLQLHSAMLDQGLLPTLKWYFERYSSQTKLHVVFKHSGLERDFPGEISAAAYRIIQSSLTNVVRHAGVKEAEVEVWADNDALHVKIEDHGVGFEPAAKSVGDSTGLPAMKERAFLLGGKFEIKSSPGAGATVTAEFPLKPRL